MGCTLLIKCSSASLVSTTTRPIGLTMGKAKIRPPTESTPLNRLYKKLPHVITWRPPTLRQIYCKSVTGGPRYKWVKYNEIFNVFICKFFGNTSTGQTACLIFKRRGFFFMYCVLFSGLTDIPPYLGSNFPKKTSIMGREETFSSQTYAHLKSL